MGTSQAIVYFNPSSQTPGPFEARADFVETATGTQHRWRQSGVQTKMPLAFALDNFKDPSDYEFRLDLDGHPAYMNRFQLEELPF